MLTKLIVFGLLWTSPSFASAGLWFTFENCQSHLEDLRPISGEAHEKATELHQWVTMQHPVVGNLIRNVNKPGALNLMFLISGYAIPPGRSLWREVMASENADRSEYCNVVAFTNDRGHRVSDAAIKKLRRMCEEASWADPSEASSIEFLTLMLDRSFRGLAALADPKFRAKSIIAFDYAFGRMAMGAHQNVSFSVRMDVSTEDSQTLTRLAGYLDDPEVRRDLAGQVSRNLPRIIAFHRKLQRDMNGVTDREGVRILFKASLSEWTANELTAFKAVKRLAGREIPLIRPKSDVPLVAHKTEEDQQVPRADEPKVEIDRDFLKQDHEISSIAKLPILEVHRDVRAASTFLTATLARLNGVDPSKPEWARLLDSVPALESQSRGYAKDLDVVLRLHAEVWGDVSELKVWLTKLNGKIESLDLGSKKDDLARLPSHDQILISSIVSLLPTLLTVTDRALESFEVRRERLAKEIDAVAHVGVFASNHYESLLRGDGSASLKTLRDAVTALAETP